MTKRLLIALAALALASFALSACGGDDSSTSSTAESSSTAADTGGGSGGATIKIEADPSGTPAWVNTDLTAKAGSDTIELVNESATEHNLVIESESGDQVAETDTVAGGTASTTADLKPGTYTFYCAIPGHRDAGMEGTLTVK